MRGLQSEAARDYDRSMLLRFALLVSVLGLLVTSCGQGAAPGVGNVGQGVTTTNAYDPPPSDRRSDLSVLPPPEDADRFNRGRARISSIEGYPVADAESWALDSGWHQVRLVDLDHPSSEMRDLAYDLWVIGLYTRAGVVVEAWTGG
jgi:hypothetical protein